MKLIIGLGNPGSNYRNTRHNTGFLTLDKYAQTHGLDFQTRDRFHAQVATTGQGKAKLILAKPTTFYNDAGLAARTLADYYGISPKDILVIHDELMLPFGTIRTRRGGSDAGNNGIKSLNEHIGRDTARVRIGIYNEPRERQDDADFVLSRFDAAEQDALEATLLPKLYDIIDDFVASRFDATTHS